MREISAKISGKTLHSSISDLLTPKIMRVTKVEFLDEEIIVPSLPSIKHPICNINTCMYVYIYIYIYVCM